MFSRMLKKMERVILSKEPSKWLKMIDQILTRSYFSCFSTLTFQTWYLSRQSSLNYGKELRKSLFIVGEFYSFMSDFYLSAKAVTYNCDRLRDRLLQHRSMFISWLVNCSPKIFWKVLIFEFRAVPNIRVLSLFDIWLIRTLWLKTLPYCLTMLSVSGNDHF